MATLTVQQISGDGLVPTTATPTASTGDTFATNAQRAFLIVNNGSANPITVTVNSAAAAGSGLDDDLLASVAAGDESLIGPFPQARFGTSATVICSAVTDVTIAAVKI